VKKVLTETGVIFLEQEGTHICVYCDENKQCLHKRYRKISIPLYTEIADYCADTRRSYGEIHQVFGAKLRAESENEGTVFNLPQKQTGGSYFAKLMGRIAGSLSLFCIFVGRKPAQINIVHAACARCSSSPRCGELRKCKSKNREGQLENYYDCGAGVKWADPSLSLDFVRRERLRSKP